MKILLFLNLFFISLFAQSSVWKISKANDYIYVGGTIHILSKQDYPLPKEFLKAYNNSEILVFESNLDEMNSPKAQRLMQKQSVYKQGDSLKNYLSDETLALLINHLQKEGLPVNRMLQLKPGILTTIISLKALKDLGISEEGVDSYFSKLAKKDGKTKLYLESSQEQIGFITTLGLGNEENYIRYSLDELKNISYEINSMRNSWRKGEINLLNKDDIEILKTKFPNIYQNILLNRNNNWMPKIEEMFKTKEIEYVLVGALHLSGKDGILHRLESLGYKVQRVK